MASSESMKIMRTTDGQILVEGFLFWCVFVSIFVALLGWIFSILARDKWNFAHVFKLLSFYKKI